jgi:O-glycosyl hydrolase/endonuclease/exonuclease/phosphatase family metal-dependent hydrolase
MKVKYIKYKSQIIRYLTRSIFSTALLLCWSAAQASYSIYFNNNTPNTVDYTSFLKPTSSLNTICSRLGPQYYHAYSGIVQAYQKVQLFNINYGKDLSKRELFCFQSNLTIHPKNAASSTITMTSNILGDAVGSEIQSAFLTIGGENYSLFTSKPYPKPVALVALNNLNVSNRSDYSFYAAAIHYFFTNQSTNELDYVLSLPQTRFTRNDNEAQLAVGTYNVQLWSKYAGSNMRLNKAYLRAQLIPLNISHYDVVVLEGLMDRKYRTLVNQLMKEDYPYQYGPTMDSKPLSGGTVIYSHWPILKKDSIIYRNCNKIDCGSAKGALYVQIKKVNTFYHIFGTHLQATEGTSTAATDKTARERQFTQLLEFIKKQEIVKNQAVIIAGDLNIDYQSCFLKKDCEEYQKTIQSINKNYPAWDNIEVLPFGSDPSKNLMNTDSDAEMEDYVVPVSVGYLAPMSQRTHIRVIREPAIPMMYDGGTQILRNPFGDLDLSDHFMLESMLSYPPIKKTPNTNSTYEEKKQHLNGFILLNEPEITDNKLRHLKQPDVNPQQPVNKKNAATTNNLNSANLSTAQIDFNKNKQTIEGFGSFAGRALPFFRAEKRDKIAEMLFSPDGLRLSIIRMEISPDLASFASIPKDLSVNDLYFDSVQWGKLTEDEKEWRAQLWIVLKAKSLYPDIKVIASTWTPPLDMKTRHSKWGGPSFLHPNELKPEYYGAFSNYLVEKFIIPSLAAGIPIEAVSPQNEPEFATPSWSGCVWLPWQTANFIEKFKATLKEKHLKTKIIMGEVANSVLAELYWDATWLYWNIKHFFIKSNFPVDIVATHGYSFPPGKAGAVTYNRLQLPSPLGGYANHRQRYVTEISSTYPYDPSMKNALCFAVSLHKFLTQGDMNAFIFWLSMLDSYSNEALIVSDKVKNLVFPKVFDVFGQFSRYILPGSIRVTVKKEFPRQTVYISAYKRIIQGSSSNFQELTIILINNTNQANSVRLNLKGIVRLTSSWKSVALTDSTHRWEPNSNDVKLHDNNEKLTITMPANSVVTIRGEGVLS